MLHPIMEDMELKKHNLADITVLYEDADMLVVNKPVGYLVHADGRTDAPTVVEWFLARAPEARGIGEPGKAQDGTPLERSGVVHRLDRDTSGVLILAKNQAAFEHLKAQFHDRLAKKEYRAFVHGRMKEEWGTINRPIGRSTKDFRLRSAEKGARGVLRDAVTEWKLLNQSEKHAYIALFPKTGRTHQLRVHLKSISRPIVGDTLYTTPQLKDADTLGFSRLALHAHRITIAIPNGKTETIEAPLPPDFEAGLHALATAEAVC